MSDPAGTKTEAAKSLENTIERTRTMYPLTEYEMSEADLAELLDACKSTPVMMIGGYSPPSPQENANRAWAALGKKMGFNSDTVRPVEGKGSRFFMATPSENETQRAERLAREIEEKRQAEIRRMKGEIAELQRQLEAITTADDIRNAQPN